MLITHNLKAAWRKILKYKVQNTISVLCLSVGVICFAATFVAVKDTHILPFAEKYFNDKIEFLVKRDGMVYPPSLRELKRLQNQQCIKEVDICRQYLSSFFVEGSDGMNIALLVSLLENNVEVIEDAMRKLGFLRNKLADENILVDIKGREWVELRFEGEE